MNASNPSSFKNIEASIVWIPSFSFPLNPFNTRFTLNWRDNLMIAGVVLTVGSAVASFFAGLALTGVAFTAAAALLLYSAYYVHNFNNGIELEQTVNLLRKKNEELITAERTLEVNAAELRNQYSQIQGVNQTLNQTVSSLQGRTRDLQAANTELSRNNQTLQGNLQQYQQTNQSLQQRINALQQAIPILKEQVANFARQNIDFGRSINVLNLDNAGLEEQNKRLAQNIHGFDMTFDANVLALSQEIHRAQTVSQTLFSSIGQQKKDLEKQVQTFQSSVDNLQALEEILQQRTSELQEVQKQIQNGNGDLQKLQQDLANTQTALNQTKDAFNTESQKLLRIQTEISTEESKLEQTKIELEAIPSRLQETERKLNAEISLIEEGKKNLVSELDKKIEEKLQHAKKLNEEIRILEKRKEELAN